jgi:hypothetical protein
VPKSDRNRAFVVGVGMTRFEKPGHREDWDYPQMAKEAGTRALEDASTTTAPQGLLRFFWRRRLSEAQKSDA